MTWSFKANFSRVRTRGSQYRQLKAEGYFCVTVTGTDDIVTKSGNSRALLRLKVVEGEHKGCTETFGMNLYTGDSDDYLLEYWQLLLVSLGVSEEKLATDTEIHLKGESLVGKTGYLHFTPAPTKDTYPNFKWMTKGDYEFLLAREAEAPAQEAQTAAPVEEPVAAPKPAPQPVAAPVAAPVQAESNADPLAFLEI